MLGSPILSSALDPDATIHSGRPQRRRPVHRIRPTVLLQGCHRSAGSIGWLFADTVVAIACTLLVLPLVDVATRSGGLPVDRILRDQVGQLGLSHGIGSSGLVQQHAPVAEGALSAALLAVAALVQQPPSFMAPGTSSSVALRGLAGSSSLMV